jgi:hypothetical protein
MAAPKTKPVPRDTGSDASTDKPAAHRNQHAAILLLITGLLANCWPASASAETVILLEPDQSGLEEARDQAEHILSQTLQAEGARILSQREAETRVGGGATTCTGPECTAELVRGAGADAAIGLSLWEAGTPAGPGTVLVTVVDRAGQRFPGKALVQRGDVARATKDALLDARSLQLLGPGPWLRVRSFPDGAEVLFDGKPMGVTPTRAAVTPGRHTLEIRLEGLRPHAQTVDIPASAARQIEIDTDLAPRSRPGFGVAPQAKPASAGGPLKTVKQPPSRPILGPLILGTLGAAIVAYEVIPVVSSLCETRDASDVCIRRAKVNAGIDTAIGAVGVAAMAGGLLWYVFGGDHADQTAPVLSLSASGVQARGRF